MPEIQKTIGEFVKTRALPSVAPDAMVSDALKTMQEHKSDCAVVMEGTQVVGIFTERDFVSRVAAAELIPCDTAITDVMTREPETLGALDGITYAINRMAVRGFRNIPITGTSGATTAVLTVRDVLGHLTEVFDELGGGAGENWDEWTDTGGG